MQIQDECKSRCDEIEKALNEAETRWRELDERLEEAEVTFFSRQIGTLKKRFALEEEELSNWAIGGLRHTTRTRIQGLLILPLVEKMHQRVSFARPSGEGDAPVAQRTANRVLDALFDYWENR